MTNFLNIMCNVLSLSLYNFHEFGRDAYEAG